MTYFVQQEHTPEQCLKALDEMAGESPKLLETTQFACNSGEHRGYSFVEAYSDSDAIGKLPTSLREGAKAVKVDRFTPEQIRSFHQK